MSNLTPMYFYIIPGVKKVVLEICIKNKFASCGVLYLMNSEKNQILLFLTNFVKDSQLHRFTYILLFFSSSFFKCITRSQSKKQYMF